MTKKIILKRSSLQGASPSSLDDGELAINTYDGRLYLNKVNEDGDKEVSQMPTHDDLDEQSAILSIAIFGNSQKISGMQIDGLET